MPDGEHHDFVMRNRLCFSCLRTGHQSRGCYKKKPCVHCNRKHASVMHPCTPEVVAEAGSGDDRPQNSNSQSNTEQSSADLFCGLTTMGGSVTELSNVAVKVRVRGSSVCVETYALLDNGSNSTFCSASLLERLGINGTKTRLKLTTIDSSKDVDSLIVTDLEVTDLDESECCHSLAGNTFQTSYARGAGRDS